MTSIIDKLLDCKIGRGQNILDVLDIKETKWTDDMAYPTSLLRIATTAGIHYCVIECYDGINAKIATVIAGVIIVTTHHMHIIHSYLDSGTNEDLKKLFGVYGNTPISIFGKVTSYCLGLVPTVLAT